MKRNFLDVLKRLSLNPTNKEIVEKTGFNKGTISSYLNGKIEPSDKFLEVFSIAYGIDLNAFYLDVESELKTLKDENNQLKNELFNSQKKVIELLEKINDLEKNANLSNDTHIVKLKTSKEQ